MRLPQTRRLANKLVCVYIVILLCNCAHFIACTYTYTRYRYTDIPNIGIRYLIYPTIKLQSLSSRWRAENARLCEIMRQKIITMSELLPTFLQ